MAEDRSSPPANLQPINAPTFYISNFAIQVNYSEVTIICADTVPTIDPATSTPSSFAQTRAVAVLRFSPQAAKLLADQLSQTVLNYVENYGVLPTPIKPDQQNV